MSACEKYKEKIILYFYDELKNAERAHVESHLQNCPGCSTEYQKLLYLSQEIPQEPPLDPGDSHLQFLRGELSQKIRQQQVSKTERRLKFLSFSFITPKPVYQFGFAALLLVLGFLAGNRTSSSVPGQNQSAIQNLLVATRQIQAANSEINPFLAGVEKVKYNPNTGSVEIFYTTVNDIQLNGDLNSPAIRQMLSHAMLEEENPTVRLHAVKALQVFADKTKRLEPELIHSIEKLLDKENNLGVRLQALRLFKQIPLNTTVKNILIKVLLQDPEPAMRIQSFETLVGKKNETADFLEIAKQDTNQYLQYFAKKYLEQTQNRDQNKPEKLMRKE